MDAYTQETKNYGDTIILELRGVDNGIFVDYNFVRDKVVVNAWLRPGNTAASSNCKSFMEETFKEALKGKKVGLVRADSGFYTEELMSDLEEEKLNYIMAVRMYPLSNFFKRIAFRKGRTSAISATARKLAVIIWNMNTKKVAYKTQTQYEFLDQERKRKVQEMKKLIHKFDITPDDLGLQLNINNL